MSPLFIKPEQNNRKVCGSKTSFAIAEVQKITANVPQTCGFAVADYSLRFCGSEIEFKFAVPTTGINTVYFEQ